MSKQMIINGWVIPKTEFNNGYIEKFLKQSTKGIELNTIIADVIVHIHK